MFKTVFYQEAIKQKAAITTLKLKQIDQDYDVANLTVYFKTKQYPKHFLKYIS